MSAATLLHESRSPGVGGEIFRNPDLARSLRAIASGGRDAYYKVLERRA